MARVAMIVDFIRRDEVAKGLDLSDIISEAERTGDHKALFRELSRRLAAVPAPDFSRMTEAERAAEAERLRQKEMEGAHRLQMEGNHLAARRLESRARIVDFDPKQGGAYYNRLYYFDDPDEIDEESPLGPMRFTHEEYQEGDYKQRMCEALNILSVKIASSDVGFPIHVYGTVIARDSLDRKCLYLFRRDRDHSQLISSEDESLILTGPKRGLALISDDFVETDLKIKDHQGQDRELSKGILTIGGISRRSLEKCTVESKSLATRLSTVDVIYAYVKRAVEATIAIEVVRGDFNGEITAYSTSIRDSLVLHDSKSAGVMTGDGKGVIQLMRPVVSVSLKDMLYIVAQTGDGKSERTIGFTPRVNSGDEDEITLGATKMRVKVTWSIMDF